MSVKKLREGKLKKTVGRNVAIAMGIICITLVIVGWVGAFAYYTPIINDKDNTISSLNSQISQLTSNDTNLQTWLTGNASLLSLTETWFDGNITYYKSQISNFTLPMLGFFNLTAEDNRTNPEAPYLHISGTVHNFGIEATTLPGFIHVEAYEDNGSVAIESTRLLENVLNGQSSTNVNMSFNYNGTALASWTITVS